MLNQNLRKIRKQKGFSQETLAQRLNVVRQTVSKWEQGISVPDAEMLIRLAEVLDTDVGSLLGTAAEAEVSTDSQQLAQQLEQLNSLLAERSRRSRKIWKTIIILLASIIGATVLIVVLSIAMFGINIDSSLQESETEMVMEPN